MTLEEGRKQYQQIQRRMKQLNEDEFAFIKKTLDVDCGRYKFRVDKMELIAFVYDNNAINAFNAIFGFGFIQGMKKAKADEKRRNK